MRALSASILILWSAVALQPAGRAWRMERLETARIRSHLARVERELRARDVSALDPARRAARMQALDALHAYWMAGVFPHNHDSPGERRPYFVDRHGTRCAMAYVIERSGGAELVRRVSRTANNARVLDLASDRELVTWLDRAGMTAFEAQRVQPAYGGFRGGPGSAPDDLHASLVAAVLTVEATGIALNLPRSWPWETRRVCGLYGFLGGTVGTAVGLATLGDHGGTGMLETGLGIATFAAATYNLNHPPREQPVMASAHAQRWTATPLLRVSAEGRPQLALHATF